MSVLRLTRIYLFVFGLIAALLMPIHSMAQEGETGPRKISVTINHIPVYDQQYDPSVIHKNRLYVPASFFEHYFIQADINEYFDNGTYYTTIINHKTYLNINSDLDYYGYSYNDSEDEERMTGKWGESPPIVVKGKLMIPLRTVAEVLGLQVEWDNHTRTASLISDKQYQDELEPIEDWEAWMGEQPMDPEDASGAAISDEELNLYFKENNLSVVDYEIVSKYTAVVLTINGSESSVFAVERLRNGELGYELSIGSSADEEGVSVHRTHGFVSIAVYEGAKEHEIEYCVINTYYNKGEVKKEKLNFDGKQGFLVPLPGTDAAGTVTFYGKNGFIHEVRFW